MTGSSPTLLSDAELLAQAQQLDGKIGLPPEALASLLRRNDFAAPFLKVDYTYHLVVRERGREMRRRTTIDIDELLFWVFGDATFGLAMEYELNHRKEYEDTRRILFQKQLELLEKLNPAWRVKRAAELNEILERNPFTDSGARTVA